MSSQERIKELEEIQMDIAYKLIESESIDESNQLLSRLTEINQELDSLKGTLDDEF